MIENNGLTASDCPKNAEIAPPNSEVGLSDDMYEKLHLRSEASDLDVSCLLREAVDRYLAETAGPTHGPQSQAGGPVMPPEAFALEGPYRAWPGDLRVELRKRFLQLLALAHVTSLNWPKTQGVREVYAGLLALSKYLNIANSG
jgi:hypothetical protein